jgi:hypothetical protein
MQTVTTIENIITSDFVSPSICRELALHCVTQFVPYFYSYGGDAYVLNTFAYDPDKIYLQAHSNLFTTPGIKKPDIIPAYRAIDIERALPDYLLQKKDNGYHAMLASLYGDAEALHLRLPDCLARLLLVCIKRRILAPEYINQKIIQ